MDRLKNAVDSMAHRTRFSGVVRIDRSDVAWFTKAYGWPIAPTGSPTRIDTRFAIASGTKGLTALTVISLIQDGVLSLETTARSVLGGDLPLIDDAVTVEHLLAHRSGIGDYFDESAIQDITEYVLRVPVHELATVEQHLTVLDGHPTVFTPARGSPTAAAAMWCSRSSPSGRAASSSRSWFVDACASRPAWATRSSCARTSFPGAPRSAISKSMARGRTFSTLEGSDPGISFRSTHDPATRTTYTVISNTTEGAWPIVELIDEHLE